MNLSCKDVEIVDEKTWVRWRAHWGLRLDKAGERRAQGNRWLKYNFLLRIADRSSYCQDILFRACVVALSCKFACVKRKCMCET